MPSPWSWTTSGASTGCSRERTCSPTWRSTRRRCAASASARRAASCSACARSSWRPAASRPPSSSSWSSRRRASSSCCAMCSASGTRTAATPTLPSSPPGRASWGHCLRCGSCWPFAPATHACRPRPCAPSSAPTWARSSASWRRSTRSMRSGLALALGLLLVLALPALAAEPRIPAPEGFVTDRAGVIPPATRERLTALLEELKQKTGAEIAVVTVRTTAPLDDFTYAMRIADAWKPGRKREDTGIVFLVAVQERKLRILTGYGLEGILPDGLVGEIEDREIVPAFRVGRMDEGIWRGVVALAGRIAAARGVELTGVTSHPVELPGSAPGLAAMPLVLLVVILIFLSLVLAYGGGPRWMYGRRGGFYSGGFGGGFGGGGGGFGGFGGGSFGGGGAGRGW